MKNIIRLRFENLSTTNGHPIDWFVGTDDDGNTVVFTPSIYGRVNKEDKDKNLELGKLLNATRPVIAANLVANVKNFLKAKVPKVRRKALKENIENAEIGIITGNKLRTLAAQFREVLKPDQQAILAKSGFFSDIDLNQAHVKKLRTLNFQLPQYKDIESLYAAVACSKGIEPVELKNKVIESLRKAIQERKNNPNAVKTHYALPGLKENIEKALENLVESKKVHTDFGKYFDEYDIQTKILMCFCNSPILVVNPDWSIKYITYLDKANQFDIANPIFVYCSPQKEYSALLPDAKFSKSQCLDELISLMNSHYQFGYPKVENDYLNYLIAHYPIKDIEVLSSNVTQDNNQDLMDVGDEQIIENDLTPLSIKNLKTLGYQEVDGNGDCFYTALNYYLELGDHGEYDVKALRKIVTDELRKKINANDADSAHTISVIESYLQNNQTIDDYLKSIEEVGEWADHLPITILATAFNRPIYIIDEDGNIRDEALTQIASEKSPIFIFYNGHNHYDALIIKPKQDTFEHYSKDEILQELEQLRQYRASLKTLTNNSIRKTPSSLVLEPDQKSILEGILCYNPALINTLLSKEQFSDFIKTANLASIQYPDNLQNTEKVFDQIGVSILVGVCNAKKHMTKENLDKIFWSSENVFTSMLKQIADSCDKFTYLFKAGVYSQNNLSIINNALESYKRFFILLIQNLLNDKNSFNWQKLKKKLHIQSKILGKDDFDQSVYDYSSYEQIFRNIEFALTKFLETILVVLKNRETKSSHADLFLHIEQIILFAISMRKDMPGSNMFSQDFIDIVREIIMHYMAPGEHPVYDNLEFKALAFLGSLLDVGKPKKNQHQSPNKETHYDMLLGLFKYGLGVKKSKGANLATYFKQILNNRDFESYIRLLLNSPAVVLEKFKNFLDDRSDYPLVWGFIDKAIDFIKRMDNSINFNFDRDWTLTIDVPKLLLELRLSLVDLKAKGINLVINSVDLEKRIKSLLDKLAVLEKPKKKFIWISDYVLTQDEQTVPTPHEAMLEKLFYLYDGLQKIVNDISKQNDLVFIDEMTTCLDQFSDELSKLQEGEQKQWKLPESAIDSSLEELKNSFLTRFCCTNGLSIEEFLDALVQHSKSADDNDDSMEVDETTGKTLVIRAKKMPAGLRPQAGKKHSAQPSGKSTSTKAPATKAPAQRGGKSIPSNMPRMIQASGATEVTKTPARGKKSAFDMFPTKMSMIKKSLVSYLSEKESAIAFLKELLDISALREQILNNYEEMRLNELFIPWDRIENPVEKTKRAEEFYNLIIASEKNNDEIIQKILIPLFSHFDRNKEVREFIEEKMYVEPKVPAQEVLVSVQSEQGLAQIGAALASVEQTPIEETSEARREKLFKSTFAEKDQLEPALDNASVADVRLPGKAPRSQSGKTEKRYGGKQPRSDRVAAVQILSTIGQASMSANTARQPGAVLPSLPSNFSFRPPILNPVYRNSTSQLVASPLRHSSNMFNLQNPGYGNHAAPFGFYSNMINPQVQGVTMPMAQSGVLQPENRLGAQGFSSQSSVQQLDHPVNNESLNPHDGTQSQPAENLDSSSSSSDEMSNVGGQSRRSRLKRRRERPEDVSQIEENNYAFSSNDANDADPLAKRHKTNNSGYGSFFSPVPSSQQQGVQTPEHAYEQLFYPYAPQVFTPLQGYSTLNDFIGQPYTQQPDDDDNGDDNTMKSPVPRHPKYN